MRFPDRLIEEIRERNDLVDVIAMYVPLKRAGRVYKARCPFHQEKTPSFNVNPEKQFYYCFGCGAGGDVFSFLKQHEKMEFADAVRFLAKRAGVALPRASGEKGEGTEILYAANAYAARYFQRNLKGPQGEEARAYLARREISDEVAEAFNLGYALPSWDGLIKAALADNHNPRSLERAGLVLSREGKEGFYDRFRHRLMFPIMNLSGKVVGFGGRRLNDKDEPKYMNSPETEIYKKGGGDREETPLLYGLYQTREAIQKTGSAVVVEGYLDFLTPYHKGVKNIVATLGTAFTPHQTWLLARFAKEVVLFYDSDEAGQIAVHRAFEALLDSEMAVFVAVPPSGMDPDEVGKKLGIEGLERVINEKRDFIDYEWERLARTFNLLTPEGETRAVNATLDLLVNIKDEIRKQNYLQKLAMKAGLPEVILRKSLGGRGKKEKQVLHQRTKNSRETMLEHELIRLLTKQPKLLDSVKELGENPFRDEVAKEINDLLLQGIKPYSAVFMDSIVSKEGRQMVASWAFQDKEEQEERLFEKCLNELKHLRTKARSHDLLREIAEAERTKDQAAARSLTSKYQGLLKGGERK